MRGKTVLCIDDDVECLELIGIALRRGGINFIGAPGGIAGLDTLRELKPDLILLDLMMPDLNGWRVYRWMRGDNVLRDVPVIIVTARDDPKDKALALNMARVNDYVTKPFKMADLMRRVYKILRRQPLSVS